ncbi:hypothetical protein BDV18DRAFT_162868 [Aspergillus unguis]
MEPETEDQSGIDYNEILLQISTNLTNALNTYGPQSFQYQTVLEMLKDYMGDIDRMQGQNSKDLNPDILSLAMGFLEIGQ